MGVKSIPSIDQSNFRIIQVACIAARGGISTYVLNLLRTLPTSGTKIAFIGISDIDLSELSCDYLPIINEKTLRKKININGFKYLFYLWIRSPFFKIDCRDIICTHHPADMLPFILFHKTNPKVCTLHGRLSDNVKIKHNIIIFWLYEFIEKFTLKHLSNSKSNIIAVDNTTKEFFIDKYPWMHIEVIPSGVDLAKFKPMDKEKMRIKYGFSANYKIIVYVGRLEREKNIDLLIKSFKFAKQTLQNLKLVLVGDGREKEHLIKLVDMLKLNDVIFMGAMPHDEIPQILNSSDLLILTSYYEASPTVIKEAIACGLPIVSTDVGDIRHIINEYIGRIADRNEKSLGQAMIELLQSDQDIIKKECELMANNFSFESIAYRTYIAYKSCTISPNRN